MIAQDVNSPGDAFQVVHPCAQYNGLAEPRNVCNQWIVVAFPRADFIGGNFQLFQPVGRRAGKRCAQKYHP